MENEIEVWPKWLCKQLKSIDICVTCCNRSCIINPQGPSAKRSKKIKIQLAAAVSRICQTSGYWSWSIILVILFCTASKWQKQIGQWSSFASNFGSVRDYFLALQLFVSSHKFVFLRPQKEMTELLLLSLDLKFITKRSTWSLFLANCR